MAIFYVLPPRPLMAQHFTHYLQSIFPGLDWDYRARINLTEGLESAATCHNHVHVVFREELSTGESTPDALVNAFGAEEGDEVIDVRFSGDRGDLISHRWTIRKAA